ncbi:alcohol dehydrogenase, class IV [Burkholderiales bacterium JOSHI_001]|nr:alcohol dehydrogenase, class IV [Burkholderiales bacterium JOSHI_001]
MAAMVGDFNWRLPVDVSFGTGAAERVAAALGPGLAVLLTLDGPAGQALAGRFEAALGPRLLATLPVSGGLGSMGQARALCAELWPLLARERGAVLLAVGGGTVMDLAKVARCRPLDGEFDSLRAALRGQAPWPVQHLHRLWLVPTTAGTGSEVTRWATVWDTEQRPCVKRSLDEAFGWAERAFIDPELSLSCPRAVLRDSALDALSHALESMWNRHANPVSGALAQDAARRVLQALPAALNQPRVLAHRTELSLAALQAGLAFSQTRTALAHALSYPVTLEQGLPHGLAVALWLPAVWRLAVGHDPAVDRQLAAVFGGTAAAGAEQLERWLQSVGVDTRLELHGIHDGAHRIEAALNSPRGKNFIAAGQHERHERAAAL